MKHRPLTDDEYVFLQVVKDNEYGLPHTFRESDCILDCGAHVGAFLFACLCRGVRHIHCYEPHPENFELLEYNSKFWGGQAVLHKQGIWVHPEARITAIQGIATASPKLSVVGTPVSCVTLDEAIHRIGGKVRLLKLDIEGAEVPVLESSNLDGVQEIVGELHYNLGATEEWLLERLKDWKVTVRKNPNAPQTLGLFKATR